MSAAITVENLGKRYLVGRASQRNGYRTLRESMVELAKSAAQRFRGGAAEPAYNEFWALKDVDFEVKQGEVLGIVGSNGAGKSTLLKILSKITKPTTGEICLRGRVGSLLEVGTGFHPELTGRENIYLNGSILGMSRRQINRNFDEIVAFAGVEQFLDTPVKRYSSGMYVRLAFAVAAHLDLEILMVDEVLAVGDQEFQKKCVGRMGDIAESGRTVLLVSHNLPLLMRLSTAAIRLDRGRLVQYGRPEEVTGAYCDQISSSTQPNSSVDLSEHPNRPHGMHSILRRVSLFDGDGNPTTRIPLGGRLLVDIEVEDFPGQSDNTVVLDISDTFGTPLAQAHTWIQSGIDLSGVRTATLRCEINDIRLLPADYTITLNVGNMTEYVDKIVGAATFTVEPADIYGTGMFPMRKHALFALDAEWQLASERDRRPVRSL